jgi:glutaredoxin
MITMYGKKDCPKCKAAIQKLALLEIRYCYVDMSLSTCFREQPRAVDTMVESVLRQEQWPMFLIDERWYDYPEAMAEIKRRGGV